MQRYIDDTLTLLAPGILLSQSEVDNQVSHSFMYGVPTKTLRTAFDCGVDQAIATRVLRLELDPGWRDDPPAEPARSIARVRSTATGFTATSGQLFSFEPFLCSPTPPQPSHPVDVFAWLTRDEFEEARSRKRLVRFWLAQLSMAKEDHPDPDDTSSSVKV